MYFYIRRHGENWNLIGRCEMQSKLWECLALTHSLVAAGTPAFTGRYLLCTCSIPHPFYKKAELVEHKQTVNLCIAAVETLRRLIVTVSVSAWCEYLHFIQLKFLRHKKHYRFRPTFSVMPQKYLIVASEAVDKVENTPDI